MTADTSNLLSRLDKVSPMFCRLIARTRSGMRMKSNADLAQETGLSRSTIVNLSRRKTWDRVPVGVAARFMDACGVDPWHPGIIRKMVRTRAMVWLKNASVSQSRMATRILNNLPRPQAAADGCLSSPVQSASSMCRGTGQPG